MSTPVNLKDAIDTLTQALKPLESLAKAHQRQADLKLLELWYSEEERNKLKGLFDAAWKHEEDTRAALYVHKETSDLRTYDQYAQQEGEAKAKMAFMDRDLAHALCQGAHRDFEALKKEHPVFSRVHYLARIDY